MTNLAYDPDAILAYPAWAVVVAAHIAAVAAVAWRVWPYMNGVSA